ncbi:MAG: hypothetical protein DRP66_08565 [Planctomycetota bacterium]|nr:MAG: hypothetical protein DRP66_08565 [Planctomycetota bacterium]
MLLLQNTGRCIIVKPRLTGTVFWAWRDFTCGLLTVINYLFQITQHDLISQPPYPAYPHVMVFLTDLLYILVFFRYPPHLRIDIRFALIQMARNITNPIAVLITGIDPVQFIITTLLYSIQFMLLISQDTPPIQSRRSLVQSNS